MNPTATITVHYTDPGPLDTFLCTFSWNDGSPDTVAPGAGGVCTADHTYTVAGIYTVDVTVADDDTGEAVSTFEYVVVANPAGGSVTGGGWISSPAGAYPAEPTFTGRANFGFNAKYDDNRLKGETEFKFEREVKGKPKLKLNFHSRDYDWLVVDGSNAIYVGSGEINGSGDYAFLVNVIDGKLAGTKVDRFRIKIWDKVTGAVIYDDQPGADPYDPATFATGKQGSIKIHK